MRSLGRSGLAAALIFAVIQAAGAADLRISPTRLAFAPDQSVQTLTLSNPGSTPLLVETAVFVWNSGQDQNSLHPTRDLIVSPPIFDIPAQGQVQLRLGFRPASLPANACELSYRLWVTEVPKGQQVQGPLRLRTRVSLPVFRQLAKNCRPQLAWSWTPGQLELRNQGSGHAQLQDVMLVQNNTQWQLQTPQLGYLLPGEHWQLQLPEDWRPDRQNPPVLRAQSRQGPLEAWLSAAP